MTDHCAIKLLNVWPAVSNWASSLTSTLTESIDKALCELLNVWPAEVNGLLYSDYFCQQSSVAMIMTMVMIMIDDADGWRLWWYMVDKWEHKGWLEPDRISGWVTVEHWPVIHLVAHSNTKASINHWIHLYGLTILRYKFSIAVPSFLKVLTLDESLKLWAEKRLPKGRHL